MGLVAGVFGSVGCLVEDGVYFGLSAGVVTVEGFGVDAVDGLFGVAAGPGGDGVGGDAGGAAEGDAGVA